MQPNTGKPQTLPDPNQELFKRLANLEEKITQLELEIRLINDDKISQYSIQNIGIQEQAEKILTIETYLVQVDQYIKDISYEIGAAVRNIMDVHENLKSQADNMYEMVNLLRNHLDQEKSYREGMKERLIALSNQVVTTLNQTSQIIRDINQKIEIISKIEESHISFSSKKFNELVQQLNGEKIDISDELNQLKNIASATTKMFGTTSSLVSDEVVELRSLEKEDEAVLDVIQSSISELAAAGLEAKRIRQIKRQEENIQKLDELIFEAEALMNRSFYLRAIQLLEQAKNIDPDHQYVNILLAQASLELGDLESAEKLIGKLFEITPSPPQAVKLIGKVRYYQNDIPSSIIHLKNAREMMQNDAEVCLLLGKAYQKDQQILKAIECWNTAFKLSPDLLENEPEIRLLLEENRLINE